MKKIKDNSLYFVTGSEYSLSRLTEEVAGSAIRGGIDILQMREKKLKGQELLSLGNKLKRMCSAAGVIFIVNDDPLLAKALDADGVHLGQEDLKIFPLGAARSILGDKMIGVSTHSAEQFLRANEDDADYIAFGPIFPTRTKDYSIGTGDIAKVLSKAKKPVVFIGGITADNAPELLKLGVKNIAVIRAIAGAENIVSAARVLKGLCVRYA